MSASEPKPAADAFRLLILVAPVLLAIFSGAVFAADSGAGPQKGDIFTMQVKTAEGRPLPNVLVVSVSAGTNVIIDGTIIHGGTARARTDAEGRVRLAWAGANQAVVTATEMGFGLAQLKDFTIAPELIVKPWARLEGVRINQGSPVANQPLRYGYVGRFFLSEELGQTVSFASNRTVTDASGRFSFDHVPPGEITLSGRQFHPSNEFVFLQLVDVTPGVTNRIQVVTHGRTIIGRFTLPPGLTNKIDFTGFPVSLQPDMDVYAATSLPSVPPEFDTPDKRPAWWREWHRSKAGSLSDEVYSRLRGIEIAADGRFTADFVEPGKYWLTGAYDEELRTVVTLSDHLEIPAPPENTNDGPFDLGDIQLQRGVNLPPGAPAPDFQAELLNGAGTFRLSDYRGKYVLLEFWATWSKPSLTDIQYLVAAQAQYQTNKMFTMASLNVDMDRERARQMVNEQGMTWTQVYLGDWTRDTVAPSYGIRKVPQIVLIDPEGRILGGPHGPQLMKALAQYMAPQTNGVSR